jgi:metal-responsive CopG/Arc/MetJ family transcriptional regulator
MEVISLKLDENMLSNVDKILKKHNYSTRTEFIRDAIRDKLEEMSRKELIQEFMALKGKAKKTHTDEEWEKVKEEAYRSLAKKKKWD